MNEQERSRVHHALEFLGMRAQATAVGLVQLCVELRRAGVLDQEAIDRVKQSIAAEIAERAPRTVMKQEYLADIRGRLDRIFAGDEPIGAGPVPPVAGEDDQPPTA
ncbi:hypothetical protein [Sphingomonas sp.]|uniref:hypothetical protein n=1 Tax=Sphingomonas sp. TaxID=28214 RepID=UPI0025F8B1F6|nr:hypothetical protein [Sphingomonas sp.]MBV9529136.1 hypothetical protein [Sphingomonas sp.]